jgi:hypothetical protein
MIKQVGNVSMLITQARQMQDKPSGDLNPCLQGYKQHSISNMPVFTVCP